MLFKNISRLSCTGELCGNFFKKIFAAAKTCYSAQSLPADQGDSQAKKGAFNPAFMIWEAPLHVEAKVSAPAVRAGLVSRIGQNRRGDLRSNGGIQKKFALGRL